MAKINRDITGKLNIDLIQGDNKLVKLTFNDRSPSGVLTPIDLTLYSEIKMNVKKSVNVNETAFISWLVGAGLVISGVDNNVLEFEFKQEFNSSQLSQWNYDIKFIKGGSVMHYINGVINVNLVTTL